MFKASPIGIVPKKVKGQFRLIYHLSYPKHTYLSVNSGIPQEFESVSYALIKGTLSNIYRNLVKAALWQRPTLNRVIELFR